MIFTEGLVWLLGMLGGMSLCTIARAEGGVALHCVALRLQVSILDLSARIEPKEERFVCPSLRLCGRS